MFLEGETVVLNNLAKNGLPNRVGERCVIEESLYNSPNYDYRVVFEDGEFAKVKELELNRVSVADKELMGFIYTGNNVLHKSSGEIVKVIKPDYLFGQAEIEFLDDGANMVVMVDSLEEIKKETDSVGDAIDWRMVEQPEEQSSGKFTEIALEIGEFTDMKNKQYGSSVDATQKMIEVLMERYTYDEENYLMPKSLLKHILLQVRMMDKQNRIFNNPSGEGDSESPYRDLGGYSLIGIEMTEK
jgi:hypothetical protein